MNLVLRECSVDSIHTASTPKLWAQIGRGPVLLDFARKSMERLLYGDTSWIEDDCPDTFSEFIFLFPSCSFSLCHDFSLVNSVETLNAKSNSNLKTAGLVW